VVNNETGAPYPALIETLLFGGVDGQEVFMMEVGGISNHHYTIRVAAQGTDPSSALGLERYEHILIQDVT
jgi:hypothetical protein